MLGGLTPEVFARRLLLGVIASFIVVTAVADRAGKSIDEAALDIARNAAPSMRELETARGQVRNLPLRATLFVERAATHQPIDPHELSQITLRLDESMRRYLSLPAFWGERTHWHDIERDQSALNALVLQVEQRVAGGEHAEAARLASTTIKSESEVLDRNLVRLVDYNANYVEHLAMQIEHTRARTRLLTLVLDVICTALALVALRVLSSVSKRHAALREAHEQLLQRRADELEQFAGRVAHDILSPLAPVGLALDLLTHQVGEADPRQKWIRHARSGLGRVQALVSGLLSFARAGATARPGARADAGAVIDEVLGGLQPDAEAAGIELGRENAEPCAVTCSADLLCSALGNLVQNAIKYMGDAPVRKIVVRTRRLADRLRIVVEDTGPGFPEGMSERLFEPHVRATSGSEPGIGLGLATVRKLVVAHGGSTGAERLPPRGARFWVELPIAREEPSLLLAVPPLAGPQEGSPSGTTG
jgi:signal transduction histidine kinase